MERDVCAEPREVEAANVVDGAPEVPGVRNEVGTPFHPFFEVSLGLFTSEIGRALRNF